MMQSTCYPPQRRAGVIGAVSGVVEWIREDQWVVEGRNCHLAHRGAGSEAGVGLFQIVVAEGADSLSE
jgi:hypothetical protein